MIIRELVLAFFGSVIPSILFNAEGKKFFWIGIAGASGWLVYTQMVQATGQTIFAAFTGAFAVGIYSEVMARILKSPATVFSVSGVFPLVPGIGAYTTVQFLVENKFLEAAMKAIETLSIAGAIALGVMVASGIFKAARKKGKAI